MMRKSLKVRFLASGWKSLHPATAISSGSTRRRSIHIGLRCNEGEFAIPWWQLDRHGSTFQGNTPVIGTIHFRDKPIEMRFMAVDEKNRSARRPNKA